MTVPRGGRVVRGSGRYGIASGGLAGSGDVVLFVGPDAARKALIEAFRAELSPDTPPGRLVKGQWIDRDRARAAMSSVEAQLDGWSDGVDGNAIDVVIETSVVPLRVGIFKCSFEAVHADRQFIGNRWVIPPVVDLPHAKRFVD